MGTDEKERIMIEISDTAREKLKEALEKQGSEPTVRLYQAGIG
jgi:hypothetical protein